MLHLSSAGRQEGGSRVPPEIWMVTPSQRLKPKVRPPHTRFPLLSVWLPPWFLPRDYDYSSLRLFLTNSVRSLCRHPTPSKPIAALWDHLNIYWQAYSRSGRLGSSDWFVHLSAGSFVYVRRWTTKASEQFSGLNREFWKVAAVAEPDISQSTHLLWLKFKNHETVWTRSQNQLA